jgi:hypothetical protein
MLLAGTLAVRLACPVAAAADQSQKAETLNNESIIEMQKLTLSDGVIIDKIKSSTCEFDVTLNGLKQLKNAKVSDAVIQAMIAAKNTAPAPPGAPAPKAAATGDLNDPATPRGAGIWMYEETNGQKKMTQLETEGFRMWMGAGPFGGAMRAVLTGLNAKVKVATPHPVFYMYFGQGGQDIGSMTSPSQLPLAKFDLKPRTEERLLVIGSAAPFAGYTTGIRKQSLRAVNTDKIAEGIFKVTPAEDLSSGEYAFCYVSEMGMNSAGKMFCFGVQ